MLLKLLKANLWSKRCGFTIPLTTVNVKYGKQLALRTKMCNNSQKSNGLIKLIKECRYAVQIPTN